MAPTSSTRTRARHPSPAIVAARTYSRHVKIACDELHDDPFDSRARAALLRLIVDDSSAADAALTRALAELGAGSVGR